MQTPLQSTTAGFLTKHGYVDQVFYELQRVSSDNQTSVFPFLLIFVEQTRQWYHTRQLPDELPYIAGLSSVRHKESLPHLKLWFKYSENLGTGIRPKGAGN